MADWRDITVQQAKAARQLTSDAVARPAVSRAYYAAYSAITHVLHRQGIRRFGAKNNPDHADVPALVLHSASSLDRASRRDIASSMRRLRLYREDADYRPSRVVDAKSRMRAMIEMDYVLKALGERMSRSSANKATLEEIIQQEVQRRLDHHAKLFRLPFRIEVRGLRGQDAMFVLPIVASDPKAPRELLHTVASYVETSMEEDYQGLRLMLMPELTNKSRTRSSGKRKAKTTERATTRRMRKAG